MCTQKGCCLTLLKKKNVNKNCLFGAVLKESVVFYNNGFCWFSALFLAYLDIFSLIVNNPVVAVVKRYNGIDLVVLDCLYRIV